MICNWWSVSRMCKFFPSGRHKDTAAIPNSFIKAEILRQSCFACSADEKSPRASWNPRILGRFLAASSDCKRLSRKTHNVPRERAIAENRIRKTWNSIDSYLLLLLRCDARSELQECVKAPHGQEYSSTKTECPEIMKVFSRRIEITHQPTQEDPPEYH